MDKKEALSNYLSDAKHDLRSALGVAREGVSQVLDGLGGGDCEKCRKVLSIALNGIDEMNKRITNLLDAEKINQVMEGDSPSSDEEKK